MATVVVTLFGVAARSSTPELASVMTASVVNGTISETEPTNVVLPTPKPPATTILAEIVAEVAIGCGLEPTESTQHPFHQRQVRHGAVAARGLVHVHDAQAVNVAQHDPGDAPGLGDQR